jgi:hypothetical protein
LQSSFHGAAANRSFAGLLEQRSLGHYPADRGVAQPLLGNSRLVSAKTSTRGGAKLSGAKGEICFAL